MKRKLSLLLYPLLFLKHLYIYAAFQPVSPSVVVRHEKPPRSYSSKRSLKSKKKYWQVGLAMTTIIIIFIGKKVYKAQSSEPVEEKVVYAPFYEDAEKDFGDQRRKKWHSTLITDIQANNNEAGAQRGSNENKTKKRKVYQQIQDLISQVKLILNR